MFLWIKSERQRFIFWFAVYAVCWGLLKPVIETFFRTPHRSFLDWLKEDLPIALVIALVCAPLNVIERRARK